MVLDGGGEELGLSADDWPAYASLLVLEAWAPPESGEGAAAAAESLVRFVFRGKAVGVPGCEEATTAEGLCPLSSFLAWAASLLPTDADCAGVWPGGSAPRPRRGQATSAAWGATA